MTGADEGHLSHLLEPELAPEDAYGYHGRPETEKAALRALHEALLALPGLTGPEETAALLYAVPPLGPEPREGWADLMGASMDAAWATMRLPGGRTFWVGDVWVAVFTGEVGRLAVRAASRVEVGEWLVGCWPAMADRWFKGGDLTGRWSGSLMSEGPWTVAQVRRDPGLSCRGR